MGIKRKYTSLLQLCILAFKEQEMPHQAKYQGNIEQKIRIQTIRSIAYLVLERVADIELRTEFIERFVERMSL